MAEVIPALKNYVWGMLHYTLVLYFYMMMVYFIAGWFISNRNASWYVFCSELIDPPLNKLRQLTGGKLVIERFDLTPILLIAAVQLAQYLLYKVFYGF